MKKTNRFLVIGGQYEACYYGSAETLIGAKRIASKYDELWDNWQGFHRPRIYAAEDCVEVENFYGHGYAPDPDKRVFPVSAYDMDLSKWIDAER